MKSKASRIFSLVFLALASAVGFAQAPTPEGAAYERAAMQAIAANPNLDHNPYTVIVRFQEGVAARNKASLMSSARGVFVRSLVPNLGIELWGTATPEATVAYLKLLPSVKYAELDYVVHTTVIPNDPSFGSLWGMHNTGQSGGTVDADIDAPEAWDSFTGDPNFVIADIDTGVDYLHPDLAANSWINPGEIAGNGIDDDGNGFIDDTRGWDFVNNDNNPIDDNNHGSHTSGTIGGVGNNGVGVAGVNWRCQIMALKFLNAAGSGSTSGAISCVNYARVKGVKVSNNSWGGGGFSQALFDAINASKAVGHIFCAAAGNAGANNDVTAFYPANYNLDNVIAVASINRFDARSSFSNFGATTVDLGAPGESILSTTRNNTYSTFSGTSMACPHVVGVVALVYALNPTWTYQQVRTRIFNTVRPTAAMNGITVTGGVLNAAAAVGGTINTPPSVVIASPTNGSSFVQGSTVNFVGSASDTEQGDLTGSLSWSSNLQGVIGTGGSFSRSDLVVGTHVVTASVTDAGGLTGTANVTITITPSNTPPTVTITSPTNGASFVQGTSISFTGSANDAQQGDMTASLSWSSNLQGALGTGGSFSRSDLVVGSHVVTASVTDAGGLTGSASVTITITSGVTIPNAPSGLTVIRLMNDVARLNYVDNSNNETSFDIQRQRRSGGVWGSTTNFTVGANVTQWDNAAGNGTFRYRVRATNSAGSSAYTGWVQRSL